MNNKKIEAIQKMGDNKMERVSLAKARDMMWEKFRTNIRLLRAKEGWSGVEAGEKIGLKNGKRMIELEYGRGNPTSEELMLISKCCNVSLTMLIEMDATVTFVNPSPAEDKA